MVFSSSLFLFYFLPVALGLYYCVPKSARHLTLTLLSYVFYGWSQPLYAVLMLSSTVVDFALGWGIARAGGAVPTERGELTTLDRQAPRTALQKVLLTLSVVLNLGLLGYFKYTPWLWDTGQQWLVASGWQAETLDLGWRIVLPVGISFYTFQSLSYTIDVYRGLVPATRRFIDFACYVSLFPQLVAGPIVRYPDLVAQLHDRAHTSERFLRGIVLFEFGLAKKVLLANPCGVIATAVFQAGEVSQSQAWWGLLAYAWQIYFDFSGYSDMAVGLGRMFGFEFPRNFDAPYRSATLGEFWQRWHITLGVWLREYLYIPLGGNRRGLLRTALNVWLVMLLGGIWHGASWTFVGWGIFHGTWLVVERLCGIRPARNSVLRVGQTLGTFLIVLLGWVLFRADTITHAGEFYRTLCGLNSPGPQVVVLEPLLWSRESVLSMVLATGIVCWAPTAHTLAERSSLRVVVWACLLGLLAKCLLTTQQFNPFLYFQF